MGANAAKCCAAADPGGRAPGEGELEASGSAAIASVQEQPLWSQTADATNAKGATEEVEAAAASTEEQPANAEEEAPAGEEAPEPEAKREEVEEPKETPAPEPEHKAKDSKEEAAESEATEAKAAPAAQAKGPAEASAKGSATKAAEKKPAAAEPATEGEATEKGAKEAKETEKGEKREKAPKKASAKTASGKAGAKAGAKKTDEKKPEEKGDLYYNLKVTIKAAKGLRNADGSFGGTSDPFCICEVPGKPAGRFSTKVINDTTEPKWDLVAEVNGFANNDSLKFTVWDKDTFSADDLLGQVTLPILKVIPLGFDGTLKLEATDGGSAVSADSDLHVKVDVLKSYVQEKAPALTAKKLLEKGSEPGEGNPKLTITVVHAKGLRNADWGGASDPYCVVEVPGKCNSRIKTPWIQDKLDPVWNYTKQLADWAVGDSISIAVFDKDPGVKKDDLLGRCSIPADTLYPLNFDADIPLLDAGKGIKAYVRVKTHIDWEDGQEPPKPTSKKA